MIHVNEDNRSGFHSNTFTQGVDRQVTGGNDAPVEVGLQKLKASAKEAKDIIMGNRGEASVSASGSGSGSFINIDDHSIHIDNSIHHSSLGDGLAWFGTHWKEVAIVAGAAALIYAIAKMIKVLDKSIKIRYNKVVRTLQRAQRDFTLKPDGLNMASVLPGVGSRINDWLTRMLTGNWKSKRHINGNIGLHPFCSQYIDEIAMDFKTAQEAFSKIKLGADESSVDDDRNNDASVGGAQHTVKSVNPVNTSADGEQIYSSFREAYASDFLNEGVAEDKVNESVLAMLSVGVTLASLAVRGGMYLYQRYKDGKAVGQPKKIQVSKESTREICYAIINNYADKYVNMQQVFKEIGINTNSLADLDSSACDKLAEILKKYQKPEKNSYTKQYARIEAAYKKMLKHYFNIGYGIIDNFVTHSEGKDEKHANLIVASKEKLLNMWDSQKEFYENNFSHVIIEIVASNAYIGYLDFIIEKVIPVFKSGLAGDADYVLDVIPRKGEYYLVRQTGNGQANLGEDEKNIGNVAIAEVISCDANTKKMKFKLVGLVKGEKGGGWKLGDDGVAILTTNDIDYDVYNEKGEFDEEYKKWLSLDPILLNWSPESFSPVFYREIKMDGKTVDQYIYAKSKKDLRNNAGRNVVDKAFNNFVLVTCKHMTTQILSIRKFTINNNISEKDFADMCEHMSRQSSEYIDFHNSTYNKIKTYVNYYEGEVSEPVNVNTTDELIEKINETPEKEAEVKVSDVFFRHIEDTDQDQYVYAYGDKDDKDEYNTFVVFNVKKDTYEILSVGKFSINNYLDGTNLEKFLMTTNNDPALSLDFENKNVNFNDSDIKKAYDKYRGNKPENPEDVETTDELIKVLNDTTGVPRVKAVSRLYRRERTNQRGRDVIEYMYAIIQSNFESTVDGEKQVLNEDDDNDSSVSVIAPNSDVADKDLVNLVYIATIDKSTGKTILDDADENKFDGSSVTIDPACSIKDIDKKANELGFETVDDDAAKIKNIIMHNVLSQRGNVRTGSVGKMSIDDIDKALETLENREGSVDKLVNDADEIAERILEVIKKYDTGDFNSIFEKKPFNRPNGGKVTGFGTYYLLKTPNKADRQWIQFDTGVKNDNNDQNIIFYLYPTIINQGEKKLKKGDPIPQGSSLGVIIYYNENIHQTVQCDKSQISDAIKKISGVLTHGGHIDKSKFTPVEFEENPNDPVSDFIKGMFECFEYDDRIKKFKHKNSESGTFKDAKPSYGETTSFSGNNGTTELSVGVTVSNDIITLELSVNKTKLPNFTFKASDWNANNVISAIKSKMPNSAQHQNSSVTVSYDFKSDVNESMHTATTSITRRFDKRMKNWFVLSEAVYDDGSNLKSRLDDPKFRNKLLERSDCANFAKSSKLAKFMKYENKQNYELVSEKMHTPSIATPLYESVVLVKFDKMDNVSDAVYLGKKKISDDGRK